MYKNTLLAVIAKMVLADQKVRQEEISFFTQLKMAIKHEELSLEKILEDAEKVEITTLASEVEAYPDRLYIVQQAYYAALADQDFDIKEMKLFTDVAEAFGIGEEDVSRIRKSAEMISAGQYNIFTDSDMSYLHSNYLQSSFSPKD